MERYLTGKREEAKKVKLYISTAIRHRSILGGIRRYSWLRDKAAS